MTMSEKNPNSEFAKASYSRRPFGFRHSRLNRFWIFRLRVSRMSGFTLTEVIVLLATLAIVGATLVAAAPKSRLDVQKVLCLNGKRQLSAAWRLYADDNAA